MIFLIALVILIAHYHQDLLTNTLLLHCSLRSTYCGLTRYDTWDWCQSVSPKLPSETEFFSTLPETFNGYPYSVSTPPRFLQSPLLQNTIRRNSGIVLSLASTTDPAKQPINSVFGPSLLLSNTMSLAPKINKITFCISEMKPDLACFTETWLHDGISTDCINISGYNLIYKNRAFRIHGGVCTYIRNSIKFKTLNFLHHPDFEVLWVYVRPKRLPRGVPCIVIGTVYHPPALMITL